jgi:hypothetical protein
MRLGSWTGDEVAVPGGHQVRLDEVGAHLDGEGVALQRVRRQIAVRAAVTDDERLAEMDIVTAPVAGGRVRRTKSQDCSGEREAARKKPHFHVMPPWLTAGRTLHARSDARMTDSVSQSYASRVLWEAIHVNRAHSACDIQPASRRHAG